MKKPTPTQRKILETAAGIAKHYPCGRSQHGGWSGAYAACRLNGWTDSKGEITITGLIAIGRAARIVLTVADHEKNGFISIAETPLMSIDAARLLISGVDGLIDAEAEPGADASFAFVLDLTEPNGDINDTGERMLSLQIAMSLAPEPVARWLEERPEPDAVINRQPMTLPLDRLQGANCRLAGGI